MKQLKRFVALALSGAMLLPTIALAAGNEDGGSEIVYSDTTVTCDGITFQREQEGVYAGLPLFDADPEHLDTYLDVYMDYIGLDGMVRIALEKRNDYTLTNTYNFSSDYGDANLAGKTSPGRTTTPARSFPARPSFTAPKPCRGIPPISLRRSAWARPGVKIWSPRRATSWAPKSCTVPAH